MFKESDYFTVPVCRTCGNLAIPANSDQYGRSVYSKKGRCLLCKDAAEVVETEMPYSMKRQLQMLQGMHIKMKLNVREASQGGPSH